MNILILGLHLQIVNKVSNLALLYDICQSLDNWRIWFYLRTVTRTPSSQAMYVFLGLFPKPRQLVNLILSRHSHTMDTRTPSQAMYVFVVFFFVRFYRINFEGVSFFVQLWWFACNIWVFQTSLTKRSTTFVVILQSWPSKTVFQCSCRIFLSNF